MDTSTTSHVVPGKAFFSAPATSCEEEVREKEGSAYLSEFTMELFEQPWNINPFQYLKSSILISRTETPYHQRTSTFSCSHFLATAPRGTIVHLKCIGHMCSTQALYYRSVFV